MSELLAMIHENAADLHKAGIINKKTMKEFDQLCLTPVVTYTPDEIRAIREKEQVSQAVFAHYLCSDPLNQQSLIGFFAKTGGNP